MMGKKKKTARHHHFVPQFYLRNFTKSGGKKSKLVVIDGIEKKIFETKPRNVGAERDFNRIIIDGVEPDVLEGELAKFESQASHSINQVSANPQLFFDNQEHYDNIIYLIALLSMRNPATRAQFEKFQVEIIEKMISMTYATKERYESSIRQLKESGRSVDDVSYEDIKKFVDSEQYKISIAKEWHIGIELEALESLVPFIGSRKWRLLVAPPNGGVFVTSDYPVVLVWKEPDKIPPFYRNSPGFGMKSTELSFPLTKKLLLSGDFEWESGVYDLSDEMIAAYNTKTITYSQRQIYAPKKKFYFMGKGMKMTEGKCLLGKHYDGL